MIHHHRGHNHSHTAGLSGDRRVMWAVVVNVALTLVQIAGGVLAGSLALIADAIHNLSDAVALGIAFLARKIARRPADSRMTFGYTRAEIVAALVNYTTLIVIAAYLSYEAIWRLFEPQIVAGWTVVVIATFALAVDVVTALLTWRLAKYSVNIRAAFLHNLADALGSVGVIIAGALIILFDWNVVDALITLGISGYILWHVSREIGGVIRILMLGAPSDIAVDDVIAALLGVPGIVGVHHLHLWQLDERECSVEAHIVVAAQTGNSPENIKTQAKALVSRLFLISHSTFELETEGLECVDPATIGHGPRHGRSRD